MKRSTIAVLLIAVFATFWLTACSEQALATSVPDAVPSQTLPPTATVAPTDTPTDVPTVTPTSTATATVTPTSTATATPTPQLPTGWQTPIPVPAETIVPENVDRLTLLARFDGTLAQNMSNMSFASKHKFLSSGHVTLSDWVAYPDDRWNVVSICDIPDDICRKVPLPEGARVMSVWKGLPSEYLYLAVQHENHVSVQTEEGNEVYSFNTGGRVAAGYVFEDYGFALYEVQTGTAFTTYLRNLQTGKTLRLESSIGYYEPSYADGIVAWTNGTLYVLDLNKNGAIVTRVKWIEGRWGQVAGQPAVFPGGEKVAYTLRRKGKLSLRIIDPQHAHVLADLGDAYQSVMDVSPDGRLLLVYSDDQRVHLLDTETGKSLVDVPFVSSDFRKFGYFSPDGRYVILPGASTVDVYGIWP